MAAEALSTPADVISNLNKLWCFANCWEQCRWDLLTYYRSQLTENGLVVGIQLSSV
jgi:hypothetical protein